VIARFAALAFLPLPLFFELALLSGLLRRARRPRVARLLAGAAVAVLFAASNPFVARTLVSRMEGAFPAVAVGASPRADAILVLGGAVAGRIPPRTELELVDASDRILHASRLYRAGRAPIVVVSGGRLPGSGLPAPEAADMSELLQEWGVPERAIVREEREARERARQRGIRLDRDPGGSPVGETADVGGPAEERDEPPDESVAPGRGGDPASRGDGRGRTLSGWCERRRERHAGIIAQSARRLRPLNRPSRAPGNRAARAPRARARSWHGARRRPERDRTATGASRRP